MRQVVIVGASAAGSAAVEEIRRIDASCRIKLISDERVPLYSRCLLSDLLIGEIDRRRLNFQPEGWPKGLDVDVIEDQVVEVIPASGEVRTALGMRIGYDDLLLATGGDAVVPEIPGIDAQGVFIPYRLEQAEAARKGLGKARAVVVMGGGKVGVKAAEACVARGREVTVVEQADRLLDGAVDPSGASLIRRLLEKRGVRVYTGVSLAEVQTQRGEVSHVVLDTGERIACQALLVAIGVRPRCALAQQAGASVSRGVVVDTRLRTSVDRIWAAGDVAQAPEMLHDCRTVLPNWLNAVQQGRVAGQNLAGLDTTYTGAIRTSSFRLFGQPVLSVGEVEGEGVAWLDEATGAYRRLITDGGRIRGVVQVGGEIRDVGVLASLAKNRAQVKDPNDLLINGFSYFASQHTRWCLAGEGRWGKTGS